MKKESILKVIAQDLGTNDANQVNGILKAETFNHIKYRMTGKKLGHLGYTVNIKNITKDGLKIFLANKVKLIKFEDIEQFEKAKPRVERPVPEKKAVVAPKKRPALEKEPKEPKEKISARKTPVQGSRFIPTKSR